MSATEVVVCNQKLLPACIPSGNGIERHDISAKRVRKQRTGIFVTHANVSVHVDGSCAAWVGRPRSCVETLWSSPEIPTFTIEKRLRVLDALLEWSDGLHEQQGEVPWETASSVELAERLYDEAVSRTVSYCSQIRELGDVTISEEVMEARKRAFWYPHPDDPPNN
jgi:hypothetical protein